MLYSHRTFINTFLFLAVAILSYSVFISYKQTHSLLAATGWVQHTHEVLEKSYNSQLDLLASEKKVGKFFRTSNKEMIKNLPGDLANLRINIEALKTLTQDNPIQQKRLREIQPLVEARIEFLMNMYNRVSQKNINIPLLISTFNQSYDDTKLRGLLADLEDHEYMLLQKRINIFNINASQTTINILTSGLLGDLFLILCIVLLNHNVVKRNEAEKNKRSLESRLKYIIDSSTDLVAALDKDYNFLAFNKIYEKQFFETFNTKVYIGANLKKLLANHPYQDKILQPWTSALAGQEFTIISSFAYDDTKSKFFEATYSPIRDDHNQYVGASHIMRDVTERKKVEQLKNEFISIVSHELRTPLTSIRGSLGLILGGAVGKINEKVVSMIDIAYTNSERLIELVNDILDIEKIESGKIELDFSEVNLCSVIEEASVAMEGYAHKFGVKIKTIISSDTVYVNADYNRLIQILNNFLSNAIKFSLKGQEVVVKLEVKEDKAITSVIDYGSGVPEEFKKLLFNKFSQADSSSIRKQGGSGLGLSICKSIIDQLQGTIGYKLGPDNETIFYFELPIYVHNQKTAKNSSAELTGYTLESKKYKILYIEDDLDLTIVIKNLLDTEAEVICVDNKKSAIQKLENEKFDLIILDTELTDGSGLDLLPDIKDLNSPVIVFSAYELPKESLQYVSKVLIKSKISNHKLVQAIRQALHTSPINS